MCREVPHEARIAIEEAEFEEIAEGETDEGTGTLIAISVLSDGGRRGWMATEAGDFTVDEKTIPQPLPEVPHPARTAIEEAEFEEVENAEVGEDLKHFASHENQAECPKTQRSPARSNRTGLLDATKAALSGGPQMKSGVKPLPTPPLPTTSS